MSSHHDPISSATSQAAESSGRMRLIPMRPRDPGQPGRAASSLELFFDLVFVIAVSTAAVNLHHALVEGHVLQGLTGYFMLFFAVWWAWMNFTWFASSFDTDDWLYRVLTVVQMAGVLIVTAGIGPAFTERDFRLVVAGYVLMRVVMIAQWLRAHRGAGPVKNATIVYATGIAVVQLLWIGWLFVPQSAATPIIFVVLVLIEILVPVVAETRVTTPWHPHHITERYGLFTLILLGESLLASANAIIGALEDTEDLPHLIALAVLSFVVTATLWWIYFWPPHHRSVETLGRSLVYGYAHYFIFAAAGAFSAGVEVEISVMLGEAHIAPTLASFTVTVPIAVFVLGVWWIAIRENADAVVNTVVPICAVLVLCDPLIPIPTFLTTLFMIVIVITLVLRSPKDAIAEAAAAE